MKIKSLIILSLLMSGIVFAFTGCNKSNVNSETTTEVTEEATNSEEVTTEEVEEDTTEDAEDATNDVSEDHVETSTPVPVTTEVQLPSDPVEWEEVEDTNFDSTVEPDVPNYEFFDPANQ